MAAFRALLIGLRSRSKANSQFFNVGRLEAQRKVLSSLLSTVGFVLLALVFMLGAITIPDDFLSSWLTADEEIALAEAATEPIDEAIEASGTTENSDGPVISEIVVETLTPIPTETPAPIRDYIYVDSPIVGVYIRDLPDGDIIDVLEDRSRLSLGGESTIVDGINWILVLTDDEREGWVAEQFTTTASPVSVEFVPES
ncbi:MAG: hypothetical protein AB8G95_01640 [Anaerolineae bacterium]